MTEEYLSHLLPSIGTALAEFYDTLTPWLLFGAALILSDLRFGIKKAAKRGEEIRGSTAWRRTINKTMDYLCWVTLAGLCGRSVGVIFGIPIVSMALLLIVYGIEISSCLNNYFEYKGIKKRFNFFKLIGRKEIDDALEDIPDKADHATKNDAEPETE